MSREKLLRLVLLITFIPFTYYLALNICILYALGFVLTHLNLILGAEYILAALSLFSGYYILLALMLHTTSRKILLYAIIGLAVGAILSYFDKIDLSTTALYTIYTIPAYYIAVKECIKYRKTLQAYDKSPRSL